MGCEKQRTMTETIVALATPIGRGGIGIIRISGARTKDIAISLLGECPQPRYAVFSKFNDTDGELLDQGIALYFPNPHSFTGEDVLELQGHGGPIVMDLLLKSVLKLGARIARPGEFSERAFLNGKMDLVQAEAIADLIDCSSTQAARCALRSLQGEFSKKINLLVEQLIALRTYIEASIDFVEEELDLLAEGHVLEKMNLFIQNLECILEQAQHGYLLKEGMHIVLIGKPNVGKSSLLNRLSGRETAIVTPIPGTTRDVVHDQIQIEGMPLHITDTAGIRETEDIIEKEGIRRTKIAIKEADLVILLLDNHEDFEHEYFELAHPPLIICNKIDLTGHPAGMNAAGILYVSAKTGEGIEALKHLLTEKMGLHSSNEGSFLARRRHLDALQRAKTAILSGLNHLDATELLAEELRQAHTALSEIMGTFTTDDLLGQIFSTFCIGK